MEHLFTTELPAGGQTRAFNVTFAEDWYVFTPPGGGSPVVRIRREEDEWHPEAGTDPGLAQACTDALERYLLSQH
ncbi:hypothetical protein [Flaviaesturariibacter amylovorans]|uniref:Uncharacterized protein n=1 Tax=Flaviaesturariibacter amylovorans TaxID=1084520 RepID=A0ABP8GV34_9BACT